MSTITELPDAVSPLAPGITFAIVQGGLTVEATLAQVAEAILSSPVATGAADISQSLRLSGDVTPTQLTADVQNYNPSGLANSTVARMASDAAGRKINSVAGGADGRILILRNVGAFPIGLTNEHAGSTAANRLAIGGDRIIDAGRSFVLIYDSTSARWRDVFAVSKATPQVINLGVDDQMFWTTLAAWQAIAPAAVAFATSLTLDMGAASNFDVGAATANFTLNNPTGHKPGQNGSIMLPQDGVGGRLIAYGSYWKSPGGPQALSTPAGALDELVYEVWTPTFIKYSINRNYY